MLFSVLAAIFSAPVSEARDLGPGDRIEGWPELTPVQNGDIPPGKDSEARVTVVCFTCFSCPYAKDYEERLQLLAGRWAADERVRLFAVNSNPGPRDSPEVMQAAVKQPNWAIRLYADPSQDFARAFTAVYTPEFFVLNHERKIIYRGRLDDSVDPENVTTSYVDAAIHAALEARTPETPFKPAVGCTIRLKRRRPR